MTATKPKPYLEVGRSKIDAVLTDRGTNYGKFKDHARLSQQLKLVMKSGASWDKLTPDMQESLEMIVHKIARIINGRP